MVFFKNLEKICKINSYSKNKVGVDNVGKIMQNCYESLGFSTKIFKRETIGNHQLFSSSITNGSKVLLLGHNDTVFPEGAFDSFHQDDEYVYGPGVCDMKGGNIVALEALKNIYDKNKKIENIDVLLVSDEETGSDDSKFVTLDLAKNYDYCFVFEAAGKNNEVVVARKGVGTYTITIEGKAAHAGVRYTDGINANLEASYKLQKLTELTNLSLGTTVNVGKITGGIGANTISPKCELLLEIRFTQADERDRILDALHKITDTTYVAGTSAKLEGLIQRDVMQSNTKQTKLLSTLEKITGEKIPTEERGGVSDANHVSSCGVVTLDGFGPFGDGDHTKHERALKSSFKQRIDMVTKILSYHQEHKNFNEEGLDG